MTPARTRPSGKKFRLPLALFAGAVLLFQLAWLIGVSPYSQMDEVDHAYRAASVAHGHFASNGTASPEARGTLLRVPETMVEAAHNACAGLKYMERGNCSPLSSANTDGDVLVGSAAGNYDPVYYAIVGIPAVYLAPHSGTVMDFIMRGITMVWCDLLIAIALMITVRSAQPLWPTLGVMITALPVLLCASVAAAPNGVQMASGLLMWVTMARLIFDPPIEAHRLRRLLAFWALGSSGVLLTHSTGPLWFALSFAIGLLLLGRGRALALYRTTPAATLAATSTVAAAGLFSAAWTLLARTNLPPTSSSGAHPPLANYVTQPLAWLVQCIGAVPFRNQFAPVVVYVIGLAIILAFLVAAFRQPYRAGRWALSGIIVVGLAISLGLTYVAYATQGNSWQGRYTLAFTYGIPILTSWIIGTYSSAREPRGAPDRVLAASIGFAIGLINAVTILNIWNEWNKLHWLHNNHGTPPTWVMIALASAGAVLMVVAMERLAHRAALRPVTVAEPRVLV